MKKILLTFISFSLMPCLLADKNRDDDIFGESAVSPQDDSAQKETKKLSDNLQMGGKLELRISSSVLEKGNLAHSPISTSEQADIYFDARPSERIRAFVRTRLSDQPLTGSNLQTPTAKVFQTQFDELWLKWDVSQTVFITLGKQHLKWGSGKIWNPTDFTASETLDPLATIDRRLGKDLLKIHIPDEKRGFNYYAVLQYDELQKGNDIGAALRGEFAFLGKGEAAFSVQTRPKTPLHLGLDISMDIGIFDLNIEQAWTTQDSRLIYTGDINPQTGSLPTGKTDADAWHQQTVVGLRYTLGYGEGSSLNVGLEGLLNDYGYDERDLELYSLITGQSKYLYAGKSYIGGYLALPTPGSWLNSSFFFNAIHNMSDDTSTVRVTGNWVVFKEATIEAYYGQCLGDYGELCFRVPDNIKQALGSSKTIPVEQKALLATLPSSKTIHNLGVGVRMNF